MRLSYKEVGVVRFHHWVPSFGKEHDHDSIVKEVMLSWLTLIVGGMGTCLTASFVRLVPRKPVVCICIAITTGIVITPTARSAGNVRRDNAGLAEHSRHWFSKPARSVGLRYSAPLLLSCRLTGRPLDFESSYGGSNPPETTNFSCPVV